MLETDPDKTRKWEVRREGEGAGEVSGKGRGSGRSGGGEVTAIFYSPMFRRRSTRRR